MPWGNPYDSYLSTHDSMKAVYYNLTRQGFRVLADEKIVQTLVKASMAMVRDVLPATMKVVFPYPRDRVRDNTVFSLPLAMLPSSFPVPQHLALKGQPAPPPLALEDDPLLVETWIWLLMPWQLRS